MPRLIDTMVDYNTAINYVSEWVFVPNYSPEDTNELTLIAFLYGKDELRVLKDIKECQKKHEQERR